MTEYINFRDIPLEKRMNDIKKIKEKYPDKLPLFVSKYNIYGKITKHCYIKFLMQNDMTIGNLMYILKKRLKLSENDSVYFYVVYYDAKRENKVKKYILCEFTNIISEIYNKYVDIDGMLYLTYCFENSFG